MASDVLGPPVSSELTLIASPFRFGTFCQAELEPELGPTPPDEGIV
jgi:hypothetical protein